MLGVCCVGGAFVCVCVCVCSVLFALANRLWARSPCRQGSADITQCSSTPSSNSTKDVTWITKLIFRVTFDLDSRFFWMYQKELV